MHIYIYFNMHSSILKHIEWIGMSMCNNFLEESIHRCLTTYDISNPKKMAIILRMMANYN